MTGIQKEEKVRRFFFIVISLTIALLIAVTIADIAALSFLSLFTPEIFLILVSNRNKINNNTTPELYYS